MSTKTESAENISIPRVTGLLIIEARNSNPNGDPDRESDPRSRAHDGRGVISDVSFKRKLRELVLKKDGPVWLHLKSEMNLDDDKFGIHVDQKTRLAARAAQTADSSRLLSENHWDVRVFGSTSLEEGRDSEGKDKSYIRTGVVQFGIGVSAAKIRIQRDTNTVRAGVDVGKDADRGMAPLGFRVVEHGVYAMPFLINPSAAKHSGCTLEDIELLCRLIPYAYPHNASRVRPLVEVRHAWYFEHKSPLGSASDFQILDALTPKKDDAAIPSSQWSDYGYEAADLKNKIAEKFSGKFTHFEDFSDEAGIERVFGKK